MLDKLAGNIWHIIVPRKLPSNNSLIGRTFLVSFLERPDLAMQNFQCKTTAKFKTVLKTIGG